MSLFSLIFALLLALAFIIFLLLFYEAERRTPSPAPSEQAGATAVQRWPPLRQAQSWVLPAFMDGALA